MIEIQNLRAEYSREEVQARKKQIIWNGGFIRTLGLRAAWFIRPVLSSLWYLADDTRLPSQSIEERLIQIIKMCLWKEEK